MAIIFGVMLMYMGGAPRYYIEAHNWVDVEGIVISQGSGSVIVQYTPGFPEEGNTTYSASTCWKAYDFAKEDYNYSPGDKYMMKYNPDDPASAYSSDQVVEGETWMICLGVLMGIGAILVACALCC